MPTLAYRLFIYWILLICCLPACLKAQYLSDEEVLQRYALKSFGVEGEKMVRSGLILIDTRSFARNVNATSLAAITVKKINRHWSIIHGQNGFQDPDDAVAFLPNDFWKLSDQAYQEMVQSDLTAQHCFELDFTSIPSLAENTFAFIKNVDSAHNRISICSTFESLTDWFLPIQELIAVSFSSIHPLTEFFDEPGFLSANGVLVCRMLFPSISGSGILVSVNEDAFDSKNIDIINRTLTSVDASSLVTEHATNMARIIASAGNSATANTGVATESLLRSRSFENLFPATANSYNLAGVSVENHAYGVGIENRYSAEAMQYDNVAFESPALVHLFSSGNSGLDASTFGNYEGIAGFANLTGSFKQAKNVLVIGSIMANLQIDARSSRGPTFDGRIKPDCVTVAEGGTSESTAISSGCVALIQDAFRHMHNDSLPENYLTRAFLLAGADDVAEEGPDYATGFGNINVLNSVELVTSGKYIHGVIQGDKNDTIEINITPGGQFASFTLVWNDPAAGIDWATSIVNDLDIEVIPEDGTTRWQPFVLNSAANAVLLAQQAKRGRDSLNTVEQVMIKFPSAGRYQIIISAHTPILQPQSYAVVFRWQQENLFSFSNPVSKSELVPAALTYLRWTHSYSDSVKGSLSYSIDLGKSWSRVADSIVLSKRFFQWASPAQTSLIIFKMEIGNEKYFSDTIVLCDRIQPDLIYQCGDSVLISWPDDTAVSAWQVYFLGDQQMEKTIHITDHQVKLSNTNLVLGVAPIINDFEGSRGNSLHLSSDAGKCYIADLLVFQQSEHVAQLSLQLYSSFGVDKCIAQRLTGGQWQTFDSSLFPQRNNLIFFDSSVREGINKYRCMVFLDQNNITSETKELVVFDNSKTLVAPNPVRNGMPIKVFLDDAMNGTLMLYNVFGNLIYSKQSPGTTVTIPTGKLSSGVYTLVVLRNSGDRIIRKIAYFK